MATSILVGCNNPETQEEGSARIACNGAPAPVVARVQMQLKIPQGSVRAAHYAPQTVETEEGGALRVVFVAAEVQGTGYETAKDIGMWLAAANNETLVLQGEGAVIPANELAEQVTALGGGRFKPDLDTDEQLRECVLDELIRQGRRS